MGSLNNIQETGERIIMGTVNSILECAAEKDMLLTPLKLQKLLYINYGLQLAGGGDEREYMAFEAWTYGPVLPDIYHAYKHLGGEIIRHTLTDSNNDIVVLNNQHHVEYTIKQYGHYSGMQLVDLLHRPDGAWWKAFSKGRNTLIEHKDIKNDFDGD